MWWKKDRFLIIFNAHAGSKKKNSQAQMVQDFFETQKWEYHFALLKDPDFDVHYQEIWELVQSQNITKIVVIGGDGTLRRVVEYFLEHEALNLSFFFLPNGSANVYSHILGIPNNLEEALQNITKFRPRKMSVGILNRERLFLIALCFGRASEITTRATKTLKKKVGAWSYVLNCWCFLKPFRFHKLQLQCDRQSPVSLRPHSLVIALPAVAETFFPFRMPRGIKLSSFVFENRRLRGLIWNFVEVYVLRRIPQTLHVYHGKKIVLEPTDWEDMHLDGDIIKTDHKQTWTVEILPKKIIIYGA